jgi:hypothetical protein
MYVPLPVGQTFYRHTLSVRWRKPIALGGVSDGYVCAAAVPAAPALAGAVLFLIRSNHLPKFFITA